MSGKFAVCTAWKSGSCQFAVVDGLLPARSRMVSSRRILFRGRLRDCARARAIPRDASFFVMPALSCCELYPPPGLPVPYDRSPDRQGVHFHRPAMTHAPCVQLFAELRYICKIDHVIKRIVDLTAGEGAARPVREARAFVEIMGSTARTSRSYPT